MHIRLMEISRQAGMAEVATGVLHNVGNVLNSLSVSVTLVGGQLRRSDVANLRRATAMLREKNGGLAEFLTSDPKGKLLPEFLGAAADQLADDYEMGRAVRAQGYTLAIPAMGVGHTAAESSAAALFRHELRWTRTIRTVNPAGHVGSFVTHGFAFALMSAVLLARGPRACWWAQYPRRRSGR